MGAVKAYYMSVHELIDWDKSLEDNIESLKGVAVSIRGSQMPVLSSTIRDVWKAEHAREESNYEIEQDPV